MDFLDRDARGRESGVDDRVVAPEADGVAGLVFFDPIASFGYAQALSVEPVRRESGSGARGRRAGNEKGSYRNWRRGR